jgi:hypothetical protein
MVSQRMAMENITAREYGPIYSKMVQVLDNILQDLYHGPKLLAQLWEWA